MGLLFEHLDRGDERRHRDLALVEPCEQDRLGGVSVAAERSSRIAACKNAQPPSRVSLLDPGEM